MNERTIDINTLCKDCTFSVLKDGSQIGCAFNRLEKFKEKEFIDNKYYKIKGFCNYCRDYAWAKDHIEDMESAVIKETELRVGYVILANKDGKHTKRTLNTILNQQLKPSKIAVVFFNEDERIKWFHKEIKHIPIERAKIDIVNVIDKDDKNHLIDSGCRRLTETNFITVLDGFFRLDSNFASNLDNQINTHLRKIALVDNIGDGFAVQTDIYKLLGGSFEEPIRDKIRNLAKIQGLEDMIINYDEVC